LELQETLERQLQFQTVEPPSVNRYRYKSDYPMDLATFST